MRQGMTNTAACRQLSGGRLEVGIGAGHVFPEYDAASIAFDPPALRKRRLAESVEILRRLVDGERVDHHGDHYDLTGLARSSQHSTMCRS